jgi:nucleotide-binding universal stress UspA family protein
MVDPIVVALDGSDKDERALVMAEALADLSGADLHLVRILDPPSKRLTSQSEFIGLDVAAVTGRRDVEQHLDETALQLARSGGYRVTTAVLEAGDVAAALIRHAVERGALVVVMATRAAGAPGRALGGSVADQVMRESPRPVFMVPPGADYVRGKRVRIERVLVPLDGSALATRSLDFLLDLPRARALHYTLLEVVPPAADRTAAEHRLHAAASRARALGAARFELATLEASEPAPAIVAAVREALVDMIAMSTRGASGLQRMVLGSVAEGVVRGSEVPVLLLTPTSLAVE